MKRFRTCLGGKSSLLPPCGTCLGFMAEPDIPTVQELRANKEVETAMIYTHVLNRRGRGVPSPLDRISLR